MAITEKQIEKLNIKEKLHSERENIEKQLKAMKDSLDMGDDFGSAMEEEETDESTNFSNYIGVKKMLEDRRDGIDQALEEIEEGTYGECDECGKDIQVDILRIDPESRLCIECKKKSNKK